MFQFPTERVGRGAFGYGKVVFLFGIRNDDVMDALPAPDSPSPLNSKKAGAVLESFISSCFFSSLDFSLRRGGRDVELEGWEFARGEGSRVKEVCWGMGRGGSPPTLICIFQVNCLLGRERWVEITGH